MDYILTKHRELAHLILVFFKQHEFDKMSFEQVPDSKEKGKCLSAATLNVSMEQRWVENSGRATRHG